MLVHGLFGRLSYLGEGRAMRWVVRIVLGLVILIVIVVGALYLVGSAKLNQ